MMVSSVNLFLLFGVAMKAGAHGTSQRVPKNKMGGCGPALNNTPVTDTRLSNWMNGRIPGPAGGGVEGILRIQRRAAAAVQCD